MRRARWEARSLEHLEQPWVRVPPPPRRQVPCPPAPPAQRASPVEEETRETRGQGWWRPMQTQARGAQDSRTAPNPRRGEPSGECSGESGDPGALPPRASPSASSEDDESGLHTGAPPPVSWGTISGGDAMEPQPGLLNTHGYLSVWTAHDAPPPTGLAKALSVFLRRDRQDARSSRRW